MQFCWLLIWPCPLKLVKLWKMTRWSCQLNPEKGKTILHCILLASSFKLLDLQRTLTYTLTSTKPNAARVRQDHYLFNQSVVQKLHLTDKKTLNTALQTVASEHLCMAPEYRVPPETDSIHCVTSSEQNSVHKNTFINHAQKGDDKFQIKCTASKLRWGLNWERLLR